MSAAPEFPLDPEELKRRLGKMREGYRLRAPDKVAAVQLLWERAKSAGPEDAVREELVLAAHTMSGSASTLGCEELGSAAMQLESALRSLFALRRPLSDGDRAAIGRLVEALGKSLGKSLD
jgi:HPt (histidine-containing phosphotransfer) domain-containing protein